MADIMIKEAGISELREASPFLFASARGELAKNGSVFLAYDAGKPCGALGALTEDGMMLVTSLFVAEESRGKGIGSMLVQQAETAAVEMGLLEVGFSYSCTMEQANKTMAFFLKNGYSYPEAGDILYAVKIKDIPNSAMMPLLQKVKVSEQIYHLRSISKTAAADLFERLGTEIPAFLDPRYSVGKALPDLRLAYVKNEKVTSFLTMSDTSGVLHVDGMYLMDSSCTPHMLALVKQAVITVLKDYPQYQVLTMTGATERGIRLIEGLLEGAEMERRGQYLTGRVLYGEDTPVLHEDFGAVMARFQPLMGHLAERKMASALVMLDGALPYLELPFGGKEDGLGLYYSIEGKDGYENFTVISEVVFSETKKGLLEKVNADPEPYYGMLSEKGELLLRGLWEEGGDRKGFDAEGLTEGFLLPFRTYAEELQRTYQLTVK